MSKATDEKRHNRKQREDDEEQEEKEEEEEEAENEMYQYKLISFSYYGGAVREGFYYLYRFYYIALLRLTNRRNSKSAKLTPDTDHVTLACGFKMLSRLCTLSFLWVPCFLLDLRLGLKPTRKFILVNQCVILAALMLGIVLSFNVYTPILNGVISHGSLSDSTKLIRFLTRITNLAYVTFGLLTLLYFMSRRDFVYNFVFHQCASISLPADFQNIQAAELYLVIGALSALAEPLFMISTIWQIFKQPKFFPTLTGLEFLLIRHAALWTTLFLTHIISVMQNLLPICTQFLITMCEAYAHELIDKQMARIKNKQATHDDCLAFELDRAELTDLLSTRSRLILDDYSCTTICRDWPEIPAGDLVSNDSRAAVNDDDDDGDESSDGNNRAAAQWENLDQENHSSIVGSRIFLYKNLTKSLVELKELMRAWESQFGIFHLLCISLTGLLVAQWVVMGRAENQNMFEQQNMPLFYRTAFSLINFSLSNYVVFQKCDLLPQRMKKIRLKLFKLNLDLVDPGEGNRDGLRRMRTLLTQQDTMLIWSLFDQADRVIKEVNFRFTGKTFYNKRCLITIFTREASLILLYMQVVDIYSKV